MAGHLDYETGRWVDDPSDADTGEPAAPDEKTEGHPDAGPLKDDGPSNPAAKPTIADAAPVPDAERSVVVGDDGLVRPGNPSAPAEMPKPLSPVEKAKLIQFVGSGRGNPTATAAARAMLMSSGVSPNEVPAAGGPGAAPQAAPPTPGVPGMGGPGSPLPPNLTPGQKAVLIRARMRGQGGVPLATNDPSQGVP